MNPSIRRRLLITLLSAIMLAWVFMAISSYLDIRHQIEQLLDAQLAQSARVLLAFNTTNLEDQSGETEPRETPDHHMPEFQERLFGHRFENKLVLQIWGRHDKLMMKSPNAPLFPLSDKEYGFDNQKILEHEWRVFSLPDDNSPLVVKVGERMDVRKKLIASTALRTLLPIVIALPVLALLIWFGIGRGMAPLVKLANQVAHRAPSYLEAIESRGVPVEVKPLVDSLNLLFQRLDMAFDRERRFTADAAHELRTPLAGLKAQAHVALKSKNEQNKKKALNLVVEGVDRASHLVQQLLTLARLDPEAGITEYEEVELGAVMVDVLTDLVPYTKSKNIRISCADEGRGLIKGNKGALAILMRNLIDNAIRYTPEGGRIHVSINRVNKYFLLRIADSGPGIPPGDREQVFKRFYRRLGNQAPGSGLGLSIVTRIAELHHAAIKLDRSSLNGLQVDVVFIAIDSPASSKKRKPTGPTVKDGVKEINIGKTV